MRIEGDQPTELACPHCGYNVAKAPRCRCPECGNNFDPRSLQLEYDRARRTFQKARLQLVFVPIAGGAATCAAFIASPTRWSMLATIAMFFIIAAFLVAGATVLAPDLVQARKALGKHPGAGQPRLILIYGLALIALQIGLMIGVIAIGVFIANALR